MLNGSYQKSLNYYSTIFQQMRIIKKQDKREGKAFLVE